MTTPPNIPAIALQLEILAQQIRHEKDPASQLLMIATARWLVERMSEQPRPATFEQPTFARTLERELQAAQAEVARLNEDHEETKLQLRDECVNSKRLLAYNISLLAKLNQKT